MVIYISNDEMEKCKKIVVVGSTNVDLIAASVTCLNRVRQ